MLLLLLWSTKKIALTVQISSVYMDVPRAKLMNYLLCLRGHMYSFTSFANSVYCYCFSYNDFGFFKQKLCTFAFAY